MAADSPEEIRKQMKLFWKVGIALLVCTVLTVVAAWITPSIIVGMAIATFKAGLVLYIFMHFWWDQRSSPIIYKIMVYTVFFAVGLMFLTLLALYDPVVSRVLN